MQIDIVKQCEILRKEKLRAAGGSLYSNSLLLHIVGVPESHACDPYALFAQLRRQRYSEPIALLSFSNDVELKKTSLLKSYDWIETLPTQGGKRTAILVVQQLCSFHSPVYKPMPTPRTRTSSRRPVIF